MAFGFRVWDKKQKKWVSNDVVLDCNGKIMISRLDSMTTSPSDLEVSFWTTQKDVHGKKIYDGDIVECHAEGIGKPFIGMVKWIDDNAGFMVCIESTFGNELPIARFDLLEKIEVIDNIYEGGEE